MSSFTKPLCVKVLDNGKHYEVLEDFTYYRTSNKQHIFKVEKGFITDFASIPRIFWSIYPPFGRYTKSAVLHDRLCVAFLNNETWYDVMDMQVDSKEDKEELLKQLPELQLRVTRKFADKMFLESMEAVGVERKTRIILYLSVRIYAIFRYGFKA